MSFLTPFLPFFFLTSDWVPLKKEKSPLVCFLPHFSIWALSSTLAAALASSCRGASPSRRSRRWPLGANECARTHVSLDVGQNPCRRGADRSVETLGFYESGSSYSSRRRLQLLLQTIFGSRPVRKRRRVLHLRNWAALICSLAAGNEPRGSLSPNKDAIGLPRGV